jgi:hypothetical protein
MRALAMPLMALLVLGCHEAAPCDGDEFCQSMHRQGQCVPSPASKGHNFCAYADTSTDAGCDSGVRWAQTAGDSLAGTCAPARPDGGGSD